MKQLAVLLLTLWMLPCLVFAESGATVAEKDGWHFDEKGFLTHPGSGTV